MPRKPKPPDSPPQSSAWPGPAARAALLENLTRAFLAAADPDRKTVAAFTEIATALIPQVAPAAAVTIARLLAGRAEAPPEVLAALAQRGLKPKRSSAGEAAPQPRPQPAADDFLDADPAGRKRLIAAATRHAMLDAAPERRRRLDAVATLALERAAGRGDVEDAQAILSRILAIPAERLAPLFADAEALAILLKAAAVDEDGAVRLTVGLGPPPSRRGAGLQAAMARFQGIDRGAAIRLLATMTGQAWRPPAEEAQGEARLRAAGRAAFSPSFAREKAAAESARTAPAAKAGGRG